MSERALACWLGGIVGFFISPFAWWGLHLSSVKAAFLTTIVVSAMFASICALFPKKPEKILRHVVDVLVS